MPSNILSPITTIINLKPMFPAQTPTSKKICAINDKIDKMRLSATRSLLERTRCDHCRFGLLYLWIGLSRILPGNEFVFFCGQERRRDDLLLHLVEMQYKRNDFDFIRATFRVRGDVLDIFPAYEEDLAFRVELFGDEIEKSVKSIP